MSLSSQERPHLIIASDKNMVTVFLSFNPEAGKVNSSSDLII